MVYLEPMNKISSLLKEKNLFIAVAESCTGGLIAHALTNISGSSEYFDRGVVTYSNRSKTELLGVPKEMIERHGAVSKEVATSMAEGVRKRSQVDIGISTTGIAGPTGGTRGKPVGLIYIGLATPGKTEVRKFIFTGDRLENKESGCREGLNLLLDYLEK